MYSLKQCIEFEQVANPHSWFMVASELNEQAKLIMSEKTTIIKQSDYVKHQEKSWYTSNRTVILLSGFALENFIKAYLIYENPHFIGNGSLSKIIQTHKLTKLAKESRLLPYQAQSINTLKYYEDGLESWARYPCGLNWTKTKDQKILSKKLWNNYLWLIGCYERRFKILMRKGWKGPHEFTGSFVIHGSWF